MIKYDGTFMIMSEVTKYTYLPLTSRYPRDWVKRLEMKCKRMSEEDLRLYVIDEFKKVGYTLKKIEVQG